MENLYKDIVKLVPNNFKARQSKNGAWIAQKTVEDKEKEELTLLNILKFCVNEKIEFQDASDMIISAFSLPMANDESGNSSKVYNKVKKYLNGDLKDEFKALPKIIFKNWEDPMLGYKWENFKLREVRTKKNTVEENIVSKIKDYYVSPEIKNPTINYQLCGNPIINPIVNFRKINEHGLFISTAPTGSGKTYNSALFMVDLVIKSLLDETESNPVFYITDKINLVNETYKEFVSIVNGLNLPADIKQLILSKSMIVKNNIDTLIGFHPQAEEFFINLENYCKDVSMLKQYFYQCVQDFEDYTKLKNSRPINKRMENYCKEQYEKNEKNFYLELKNILKDISIEEIDIKCVSDSLNYLFPSEPILNGSRKVFFMTTMKALHGVKKMKGGVLFPFDDIEDSDFIIDEFDAQKIIIEDYLLRSESYTIISHVKRILDAVPNSPIRKDKYYPSKMDDLRKEFVQSESFQSLLNDNKVLYKYFEKKKENESTLPSIIYDGVNSKITEDVSIKIETNEEYQINNLIAQKSKKEKDIEGSDNSDSLFKFLNEVNNFINIDFMRFFSKLLNIYSIHKEEMAIKKGHHYVANQTEDAKALMYSLNIIRDEEGFSNNSIENRILNKLRYYKSKNKSKIKSYKTGLHGSIDITEIGLVNGITDIVDFKNKKLEKNPHAMMLDLVSKNRVYGISATGDMKSSVSNFSLKYLSDNIDENIVYYTDKEKEAIVDYMGGLRDYKDINLNVSILHGTSNIFSEFPYLKKAVFNLSKDNALNNKRMSVLVQFIKEFGKGSYRYGVVFSSSFINDLNSEKLLLEAIEEINPKIKIKIKMNSASMNEFVDEQDNTFIENEERKINQERDSHLIKDPENKYLVLTTYNTAVAGINLQRNILPNDTYVELDNPYLGNDKIDADCFLFMDKTQIAEIPFKVEETCIISKMKNILRLQELRESYEIDFEDYVRLYAEISKSNHSKNYRLIKNEYSKTNDAIYSIVGKTKQGVGRSTRTKCKNKDIAFFIDEDLVQYLRDDNSICSLDTIEYKAIVDACKKEMSPTKDRTIERLNKAARLASKKANETILSCLDSFRDNNKNLNKNINLWEELRELVLKNGFIFTEDQIATIELSYFHLKPQLFKMLKTDNSYICNFEKINKGVFEKAVKDKFSDPRGFNFISETGYLFNDTYVNLDIVRNTPELKAYFDSKGYATTIIEGDYALPPNIVNNIYKAAIGEAISQFYLEKRNMKLKQPKSSMYEKVDFVYKNIGIDAKNFNHEISHSEENLIEFYKKAKRKSELFDVLVYINVFDNDLKINYIKEIDEDGKVIQSNSMSSDVKIITISGIYKVLDNRVSELNESPELYELIKRLTK